jgi:hypothetical protein
MNNYLAEYFRCPEIYLALQQEPIAGILNVQLNSEDATHHAAGAFFCQQPESPLNSNLNCGAVYPSFLPSRLIDDLRLEKYVPDWRALPPLSALAKMYYFFRPILPVNLRKHVQRWYLNDWNKLSFPHWPLDATVDDLHHQWFLLSLRASGAQRIPFIWFWPEGASSCAIMTHDVETKSGRDLCGRLMDVDDAYGIKSSFQVIPEKRYVTSPAFLESIRRRGFEIVVHDLNHDGHLYRDRKQFLERAAKINSYGKLYGAQGFRAGSLYRKQTWYDALDFAYDMSVPNVAHLDPQRGGCCTVMPYFLGKILELPVTTSQDYTLFNILNHDSIDLWKQQTELIMQKHGLMSFIAHPDYLVSARERKMYEALLAYLVQLREERNVWIATPGEVNNWWRQRAEMSLIEEGGSWRIEGAGKERARIAYASENQGCLVFTLDPRPWKSSAIAIDRVLDKSWNSTN